MNVASLDLCRELYELSGWDSTFIRHVADEDVRRFESLLMVKTVNEKYVGVYEGTVGCDECEGEYAVDDIPAYDLGYLLRKLPNVKIFQSTKNIWSAKGGVREQERLALGDSPEEAATKLAIELFKQGILTKEVM